MSIKATKSRGYSHSTPFAVVAAIIFVVFTAATVFLAAFQEFPPFSERIFPKEGETTSEIILPEYLTYFTSERISVDGRLDEQSWKYAPSTGRFHNANDSAAPKNHTEAKLLWDSTHLYVAFECEDSNIIGRMSKRDANLWEEEAVEVFLCTDDPVRHGYTEIEISPANTILDLFVRYVRESNGVPAPVSLPYHTITLDIRSAVRVCGTINNERDTDTSWTVEMAIPFRDILPAGTSAACPHDGEVWRMNLYRMERFPEREFIAWSPTGLNKFHVPKRFGRLMFSTKHALSRKEEKTSMQNTNEKESTKKQK